MKNFENDDTFLARWIHGELSDDELTEFKKTTAYKDFQKINDVASNFSLPKPDLESTYSKVKRKATTSKKVLKLKSFYYVAASIVIAFGLFAFITSNKTITADFGKKLLAQLPDGSKIHLNAGSEISYKRFFWNQDKVVHLEGEGYFDIVKGDGFKVISTAAEVNVLGTTFNIIDRNKHYEIVCYSGKVSVQKTNTLEKHFIEKGDKITIQKGQITSEKILENLPNWLNNMSVFKNQPLSIVIASLERQYDVKINANTVDVSKIFTGSFVHTNLESALKTTFPVMGITYQTSNDKKTISLK